MKNLAKSITKTTNPGEDYLKRFKPLEVEIKGNSREDFERAMKLFKNMVNKEQILSEYKERQAYEKPSDKKRRKHREAINKHLAAERAKADSVEVDKR